MKDVIRNPSTAQVIRLLSTTTYGIKGIIQAATNDIYIADSTYFIHSDIADLAGVHSYGHHFELFKVTGQQYEYEFHGMAVTVPLLPFLNKLSWDFSDNRR